MLGLDSLSSIYSVPNTSPEGVPSRMGLSSSAKPVWKYSNRHAQRCVSMVILDSGQADSKIKHHSLFPPAVLSGWNILSFFPKKAHSHSFKA